MGFRMWARKADRSRLGTTQICDEELDNYLKIELVILLSILSPRNRAL